MKRNLLMNGPEGSAYVRPVSFKEEGLNFPFYSSSDSATGV